MPEKDFTTECKKLMPYKEDINKLANYVSKNFPEQIKHGGEAVDIAMRVLETMKGK